MISLLKVMRNPESIDNPKYVTWFVIHEKNNDTDNSRDLLLKAINKTP